MLDGKTKMKTNKMVDVVRSAMVSNFELFFEVLWNKELAQFVCGFNIHEKAFFVLPFFLFPLIKSECGHIYEDFVEV